MRPSSSDTQSELLPFPEVAPGTDAAIVPAGNRQPNLRELTVPLRLWPAIILTGAGAGLTSGLLMKLLRLVQHICFNYQKGDFLIGVQGASGLHRVGVLASAGVLAGLVLMLMRILPDGKGPGLTEAIWLHSGKLPQVTTAVRSLLSVVIVGMGAAIGREAALKDAGGLVGGKLSDWIRLAPEQRTLLVACGAGAGMAAAYNVPFGGALFTLEVLLGSVSLATALPAFATSFLATAVSWAMLPNEPTYQLPYLPATHSLLLWALLCGPVMGYAAVWFVRGLHWAKDNKPQHWLIFALPVMVFLILGLAAIPFPELLGNGKNVIQLAFESRLSVSLLLWLLILRPVATIACLRAGAPGGLFTPTMTFGALLGAAFGEGWSFFSAGADKRSCAMLGAGAVLAAATQAPISSVAFILELTYNANTLMVPLLLVVVGATFTYRRFETRTSY
ncbi:MAG TPA: chloride channel protein [Terracidiphilus sp.]